MKPKACSEYYPGSCPACILAEAHVAVVTPDGPGTVIATFYGHRAVERAEEYARKKAYDYYYGLTVEYDQTRWETDTWEDEDNEDNDLRYRTDN